jgi:hypothetical protein
MKSNFSKIDENIADAPYRVNRKAPWLRHEAAATSVS